MQKKDTRGWLKSRHTEKTKDQYVKTKAQLQSQYDVENVFFKFDDDCSGTLDCRELWQMFMDNDIEIPYKDIKKLFDIVDHEKAGYLDLQKFKDFSKNKEARLMFKEIIKEVREKRILPDGTYPCLNQLPYNFNIMLEYLSSSQQRRDMLNNIETDENMLSNDDHTFPAFIRLFRQQNENLNRDLVGMEDLKARIKKKAEIDEESKKIKIKQEVERKRRQSIKQNFASATTKFLEAKHKKMLMNIETRHNSTSKTQTSDDSDPQLDIERMIMKAVKLKEFRSNSKLRKPSTGVKDKTRNVYNMDLSDMGLPSGRMTANGQRDYFNSQIDGIVHKAKHDGKIAGKAEALQLNPFLSDTPKSLETMSKTLNTQTERKKLYKSSQAIPRKISKMKVVKKDSIVFQNTQKTFQYSEDLTSDSKETSKRNHLLTNSTHEGVFQPKLAPSPSTRITMPTESNIRASFNYQETPQFNGVLASHEHAFQEQVKLALTKHEPFPASGQYQNIDSSKNATQLPLFLPPKRQVPSFSQTQSCLNPRTKLTKQKSPQRSQHSTKLESEEAGFQNTALTYTISVNAPQSSVFESTVQPLKNTGRVDVIDQSPDSKRWGDLVSLSQTGNLFNQQQTSLQYPLMTKSDRVHQSVNDLKDAKFVPDSKLMSPDPKKQASKFTNDDILAQTMKNTVFAKLNPDKAISINGPRPVRKGKGKGKREQARGSPAYQTFFSSSGARKTKLQAQSEARMTFILGKEQVSTSILNIKKGSLLSKAYTAQRDQDWTTSETLQRYKASQQRKNRFYQDQMAGGQLPTRKVKKILFQSHHYDVQAPVSYVDQGSLSAANADATDRAEPDRLQGGQCGTDDPTSPAFGRRGQQVSTAQPAKRPTQNFPGPNHVSSSHKKLIIGPHLRTKNSNDMAVNFLTSSETLTGTAISPPPAAKYYKHIVDKSTTHGESPQRASMTVQNDQLQKLFLKPLTPDKHHLYLSSQQLNGNVQSHLVGANYSGQRAVQRRAIPKRVQAQISAHESESRQPHTELRQASPATLPDTLSASKFGPNQQTSQRHGDWSASQSKKASVLIATGGRRDITRESVPTDCRTLEMSAQGARPEQHRVFL